MDTAVLHNVDLGGDLEELARGLFRVGIRTGCGVFHAATLSSLSAPRATILIASSGNGRCSALASSHGARIQTSRSSSVSRMTGMAFGWIGKGVRGSVLRPLPQFSDILRGFYAS
jgi:hypothetical protein